MASVKLQATEVLSLGIGSKPGVSKIVFQVVDDGSLSTSFVVKGRLAEAGLAASELTALPYTNRGTGAAVAASTAITAEGIYEVDATGLEIALDNTFTSGAGTVWFNPVEG